MSSTTSTGVTWQFERQWLEHRPNEEPVKVRTIDLSSYKCVAMLGAAGSGKTFESDRLADDERKAGKDVHFRRLAEHSGSSEELSCQLGRLAEGATKNTVIYLDALDEAMVPLRQSWLAIREWLKNVLRDTGAAVRISCRSAVWPEELTTVLDEYAGDGGFIRAILQPLTDNDIQTAAQVSNFDAAQFVAEIASRRAESLARQPLTLLMLFRIFEESERLPSTLSKLFEDGLRTLAADRYERFEIGTHLPFDPEELLAAAERLACYTILTGFDTVGLHDDTVDGSLKWIELSAINDGAASLNRKLLQAVGSSGLCDSESSASFRFGHRQFAEYLAGRRLARMLPHQARSLLASPAGWENGVAGPLRETASFAAMSNETLASWLARYDPEVVGLSDVADFGLRQIATCSLLDRVRKGHMTDELLSHGELELRGFQYENVEDDLRPMLQERAAGCDDVQEYVIQLIQSWQLASMSEDLAELALDETASNHIRVAAANALLNIGSDASRERLKPLADGVPGDENNELKGLAIRCNWPTRLTVPELLSKLTPRSNTSFFGSYFILLQELDGEGFCADGHLVDGLRWARCHVSRHGDSDPAHRIVIRMAHAALRRLDDPNVEAALVELLQHCASSHIPIPSPLSPLRTIESSWNGAEIELTTPLASEMTIRHQLIDALAKAAEEPLDLLRIADRTPGMRVLDDFRWLLRRGCDEVLPMVRRTCYLELARSLPWMTRSDYVDAWLLVREQEPVCSVLVCPILIHLESDQASRLREEWRLMHEPEESDTSTRLDHPPRELVLQYLTRAEAEDPRFFFNLCWVLTLEPTSTECSLERFLTRSPGWIEADDDTKCRIVDAAKRLLTSEEVDDHETCHEERLESILHGCMSAMWLVLEVDPAWFHSLRLSWWQRWCWYILRELRMHMHGETDDPKQTIFSMLYKAAPQSVRDVIVRLASCGGTGSDGLLPDLLQMTRRIRDPVLDEMLCQLLSNREVVASNIVAVARFVLSRAPGDATTICVSLLSESGPDDDESPAINAAVSLLFECVSDAWPQVSRFVRDNEQHGRQVLERFADDYETNRRIESLSVSQMGELAGHLVHLFPPENDPEHKGAYWFSPDDSARALRKQLISDLGNRDDLEAINALCRLEQRFGPQYPWLRRPRARAERSYRLSQWIPIPIDTISSMLSSQEMRLIRSEDDVLDGIVAALEDYARRIRQDGSVSVEDLWNRHGDSLPSPKAEEHVSSKLCGAVREYFKQYAITADREVEIHRRTTCAEGGEPGSELDVLVQASARGTSSGSGIRVPIEVKLSCNRQVKSGMKDQLFDRYIPQLGATHGLYVVIWMSIPDPEKLKSNHRPKWSTLEIARLELDEQANELSSRDQGFRVRALVLDAALR